MSKIANIEVRNIRTRILGDTRSENVWKHIGVTVLLHKSLKN